MATNTVSNLPETGEEWLRLLVHEPLHLFPEGVHCSNCGIFIHTGGTICSRCGGECKPIDWRSVSRSIRRAMRRQRRLLANVKADYENTYSPETRILMRAPNFTGELSWLAIPWESAGRPKGRPFEVWRIYILGNLLAMRSELTKAYYNDDNPEISKELEILSSEIDEVSFSWINWYPESVTRREKRIKAWVRRNRQDPRSRWRRRRI